MRSVDASFRFVSFLFFLSRLSLARFGLGHCGGDMDMGFDCRLYLFRDIVQIQIYIMSTSYEIWLSALYGLSRVTPSLNLYISCSPIFGCKYAYDLVERAWGIPEKDGRSPLDFYLFIELCLGHKLAHIFPRYELAFCRRNGRSR